MTPETEGAWGRTEPVAAIQILEHFGSVEFDVGYGYEPHRSR